MEMMPSYQTLLVEKKRACLDPAEYEENPTKPPNLSPRQNTSLFRLSIHVVQGQGPSALCSLRTKATFPCLLVLNLASKLFVFLQSTARSLVPHWCVLQSAQADVCEHEGGDMQSIS